MQFYKKHKRSIKTDDEYNLLVSHLQAGTGYFYSLLLKFANDYSDQLARCVPELVVDNFEEEEFRRRPNQYVQATANQCIHRVLICLGDLHRYLDILSKEGSRLQAIKWYNAAILFDSDLGMPFNQLASLAGTDNYSLDSVYYYLRALTCRRPFEIAETNLKYIFSVSKSSMNEIGILGDNNSECVFLVKKCLIEFIHLINLFWFETSDLAALTRFIGTTLNTFSQAIQLKVKPTNARKPTFLSAESIFQLTVIVVLLNHKFQAKSLHGDELHANLNSVTIGFALNFLFYLINAMIKQVKETNIVERQLSGAKEHRLNGIKENGGYTKRSSLFRLRRKANIRMSNENEDSLFDLLDDEENDDLNELEETALSTIDALEMSSDMSETGSDICESDEDESTSNSFLTTSDDEGSSSQHNSNNSSNNVSVAYEIGRFLAHLYNESILPSIKLLADWLIINEQLFTAYHAAFDSLFAHFVELLNLLLELEAKALRANEKLRKFKHSGPAWKQLYPLSVDIAVANLGTFKEYHRANLDFEHQLNSNMSEEERGFLCVQSIIAFGHRVQGGLSKHRIQFDSAANKFNSVDKSQINGYDDLVHSSSSDPFNEDTIIENGFDFGSPAFLKNSLIPDFVECQLKNDIIPNVSHLWLEKPPKAVKENGVLRGSSTSLSSNNWPASNNHSTSQPTRGRFLPYLVLDETAYSTHLDLAKELYGSKQWMLVVPKIVLEELAKKQKNSYESKDAHKWIKNEKFKSTKYLRFLKNDERLRVANVKQPLKEEKTAHDFHVLLEACNYLNRKSIAKYVESGLKDGLDDKVILLYGSDSCFPVNYEELLDKISVRSQSLASFVKKWRLSGNG